MIGTTSLLCKFAHRNVGGKKKSVNQGCSKSTDFGRNWPKDWVQWPLKLCRDLQTAQYTYVYALGIQSCEGSAVR